MKVILAPNSIIPEAEVLARVLKCNFMPSVCTFKWIWQASQYTSIYTGLEERFIQKNVKYYKSLIYINILQVA